MAVLRGLTKVSLRSLVLERGPVGFHQSSAYHQTLQVWEQSERRVEGVLSSESLLGALPTALRARYTEIYTNNFGTLLARRPKTEAILCMGGRDNRNADVEFSHRSRQVLFRAVPEGQDVLIDPLHLVKLRLPHHSQDTV